MPNRHGSRNRHPGRFAPGLGRGLRCVVFAWFHPLLGGTDVTARGFRLVALSVVLGGTSLLLSGCSWSEALGLGWPNGITPEAKLNRELWIGSGVASLVGGGLVRRPIFWS